MELRILRTLAVGAIMFGLVAARPASAQFGMNLISNPGAESGSGSTTGSEVTALPDWTVTGSMTVIQYANNGNFAMNYNSGPIDRGKNYFAGGTNDGSASASQNISVAAGATRIDQGNVPFLFSAYLGGEGADTSNASVSAQFLDTNSNVLNTVTLGPVTAAERNNTTELLQRASTGTIPIGTRDILVTMNFTPGTGAYDYGYADNLALVLGNTGGFDANLNGNSDLVFQNSNTGQVAVWYMINGAPTAGYVLSQTPAAGWSVVGTGDFNGDGHPDIVLQNQTTGQLSIWLMNGLTVVSGITLSDVPEANWKASAIGDFNGDGQLDIAFQDQVTGQVAFWYFNGTTHTGGVVLSKTPNSGYILVGAGDFNGDGNTDLVFQQHVGNNIAFWFMDGINVTGGAQASMTPEPGWIAEGVADVTGDGNEDIIFQNSATNQVAVWYMNGINVLGGGAISTQPSAGYALVGPR